ncbi:MAG: phytanoyl-CoA dioxygenase family protein [Pseudomonadota bacterium]
MPLDRIPALAERYRRDGYLSGVEIVTPEEAARHRAALEAAESRIGPVHYRPKIHTVLTSALDLATDPRMLDLVEAMIGPDILLYNATFIIKEPHTPSHVSWHQDLTYWGLSGDDQVTAWIALSPATAESGCMRMVPGSHLAGRRDHATTEDASNVLFHGQTVADVSEATAELCPLRPGEASFHHGWTLHASMPNESDDRRIGLNIQYIAPHIRQTKHDLDTVMLVRGQDAYGHFGTDRPAAADLEPEALAHLARLEEIYRESADAR